MSGTNFDYSVIVVCAACGGRVGHVYRVVDPTGFRHEKVSVSVSGERLGTGGDPFDPDSSGVVGTEDDFEEWDEGVHGSLAAAAAQRRRDATVVTPDDVLGPDREVEQDDAAPPGGIPCLTCGVELRWPDPTVLEQAITKARMNRRRRDKPGSGRTARVRAVRVE